MDFAFNKADSRNLPKVDMVTVLEFLKTDSNFFLSELRGIKAQRFILEKSCESIYYPIKRIPRGVIKARELVQGP
ncbi:hypothetical protein M8J77_022189 [Diaphorina citri]|nr:hypothetical protein M8J77_022189 [Diaphorina citri]